MKNKLIILGVIVLLAGGFLFYKNSTSNNVSVVTPSTPPTPSKTGSTYSMTTVASHNTKSDCWTAINGSVYNVTAWIGEHPGGSEAIIGLCGIDGSSAFNGQHGDQKRPASELALFKIGTLK